MTSTSRIRTRAPEYVRTDVLPPPDPTLPPEEATPEATLLERMPDWPERDLSSGELWANFEVHLSTVTRRERSRQRKSFGMALGWLESFDGTNWDEKWVDSRIEQRTDWSADLVEEWGAETGLWFRRTDATQGIGLLTATGAVRPSIEFLHRQHIRLRGLPDYVLGYRDPETRDRALKAIDEHTPEGAPRTRARAKGMQALGQILAATGKTRIELITADEILAAREAAMGNRERKPSGAGWNTMGWLGLLPPDAPITFRARQRIGQQSVAELVDGTGIQNPRMRDLFVSYIRTRSEGLDYPTKQAYVTKLLINFWVQLENMYPGIDTLELTSQQYDAWVETLKIVQVGGRKGLPRKDWPRILTTVRAFYYDINHWATSDPERYGEFAARNPVSPGVTKASSKRQKQQRAESHRRTRERLPLLPILMNKVEDDRRWSKAALAAALDAGPGDQFVVGDVSLERPVSQRASFGGVKGGTLQHGGVLLRRLDTGEHFDVAYLEARSFWRWAAFNLMRETGVRIEELEELTHLSLTQYRLPDSGELVPLLQIAPSKDDEERVLLVSPELAGVLFAVISRVRGKSSGAIPLLRRYDYNERTTSEPLPFLFQRKVNGEDRPINRAWVLRQLSLTAAEAGIVDDAGEPITFQNHDLRRIFATEAVLAGLPVHILAKVLGHDDLDTTQGYAAVYPEEIFRRFRAFIDRRRSLRPSAEYREPTRAETDEFLGHFKRRKVSLGNCGRAYGSPCIHEHACIRCSMLQVDPREEWRLVEIVENLEERVVEAQENAWLGEVEGLQISLDAAKEKLAGLHKLDDVGPVSLGLPTLRRID